MAPKLVAPLAGAWIEILPVHTFHKQNIVAPLAGVWIEMILTEVSKKVGKSRSPRGSVD